MEARRVPNSEWYIAAKMDVAEFNAPIDRFGREVGSVLLALSLAIAAAAGWIRKSRQLQLQHQVEERFRAIADDTPALLWMASPGEYGSFVNKTFANHHTTEQGCIVSLEELEAARRDSDERTYKTEYQASFENLGTGLVYYPFDREHNVGPVARNPSLHLFWALDFNVNPMCSVLGQSINGVVQILEEMILPDSNTLKACEEFLARTAKWSPGGRLSVSVYGDATGEQRQSSEKSHILFGKTLDQLRRLGAWGGRTYGRNQRARRALVQALPQVARRTPPRETAAEAIRSLDAQFPWLAGAERSLPQNQSGPLTQQRR
jgi:hypothetical protein